jgi:hypothetical protein
MDKRVYSRKQPGPPPDDRIVTTLRTYDRSANWQPLAEAVQAGFREKFGAPFTVSFPPLNNVPLSKMALPDNVRAELQSECRAAKAGQRAYYCDPE